MFGDYSVATASRHPSSLPCREDFISGPHHQSSRDYTSVCPRQVSISQLSQGCSEQRLQQDAALNIRSEPSVQTHDTDSVEALARSYIGSAVPSRRRQRRQQGVRMLCDASHLRNIQEMVERMVQSEDQCAVSASPSVGIEGSCYIDAKVDEGYSSLEDNTGSSRRRSTSSSSSSSSLCSLDGHYKRSMDLSMTGACVSKSGRTRKGRTQRKVLQRTE
ncbi:hypothetical protein BDV97DRAFT_347324 [Delphinella strobiligena]|nr:hypothetical protein BDV97DRAFT_347324 [Delphinella strobiligena]